MYGGYDGWNTLNHLFIVELGRQSVVSCVRLIVSGRAGSSCYVFATTFVQFSIKRFLKRNLAGVGLAQCMSALGDKVHYIGMVVE